MVPARANATPDRRLPAEFGDLEPFAARWCLASESERYARRLASSMEEMRALYDAVFPRVEAIFAHCDRWPLDALPDDAQRLLALVHSFVMVSFPVEVWRRPRIPDVGDAQLERVVEPLP
jgi:hypothetical protein